MQDIRRIAFVSQRYLELQGIGPALCGAGMILGALVVHLAGDASIPAPFIPLLFGGMLEGNVRPYLQRSYQRSFGSAVATRGQQWTAMLPLLLMMMGGLADITFQFVGHFAPSVAAVALAATSSMVVFMDGRCRMHHVIGVVAGVAAAIVTTIIPHSFGAWGSIGPARGEAYVLAYTLVGLGLLATGLLDHHLLASLMRPADPAAVAWTAAAARARIPGRATFAMLFSFCVGGVAWAVDGGTVAVALPALIIVSGALAGAGGSIGDLRLAFRAFSRCERPPVLNAVNLDVPADALVAFYVIAAAAAVDSALFPHRVPLALMASTASMTAWLVVRDWPERRHYALVPVAAMLSLAIGLTLDPSRAFAMFVSAISAALAVAWIVAARTAPRSA